MSEPHFPETDFYFNKRCTKHKIQATSLDDCIDEIRRERLEKPRSVRVQADKRKSSRENVANLQAELQHKCAEIDNLKKLLNQKMQTIGQQNQQLDQQMQQIHQQAHYIGQQNHQIEQQARQIENQNQQLDQNRIKISELQKINEKRQSMLKNAERRKQVFEQKCSSLEKDNQQLSARLKNVSDLENHEQGLGPMPPVAYYWQNLESSVVS